MYARKHYGQAIAIGLLVSFIASMTSLVWARPATAAVAPYNAAPTAKISFTFDDGISNALTAAAPTLAAYGFAGTGYITTSCIGMTTIPNNCPADGGVSYMSWDQAAQLRDTYKWDIGGHTANHPMLATDNLTDAQLAAEVAGGKQALVDHGFNPVSFASPYGDYDNRVLAEVAKSYTSHRGFWDVDPNVWPYNNYIINNMQVQAGVAVNDVLTRIDQTIANNQWLVLTFHGIFANPSTDPEDYQYSTANLNTIAAYVKTKQDAGQIKAVTVADGLVASDTNSLANGDFANGITDGWTTDVPASVVADSSNHGSYPESQKSVSMTASTSSVHLFSPTMPVQSSKTYMLQSFLNLNARTSGELGYYIDEYNASDQWISGKWVLARTALTVREESFTYTPSSANVAKAKLQVYVTPNSGIHAYVDSFQWFPLETTETNNLLVNSDFNGGIAEGWSTNNATAFSADSGNHGSPENVTNSVRLVAGNSNTSLFAPRVSVSSTVTYSLSAYVQLQTITSGELGFYVDEYDVNGNWVSGQYKTNKHNTGIETINFAYQPTSSTVKKASLQVILTGNSGITGYLDNVLFLGPVAPGNLMVNGAFNSGIAGGWTTNDATNITADSTGQGSPDNPENSVKLVSTAANRHLFSPLVSVSSSATYSLSSYLDVRQVSGGQIGFYIDEYNSSGTWISGQYKTGVSTVSAGDVTFSYTPSSANVAKASLQVIVTGTAGTTAYVDNIRWLRN